jgi:hypothetical protein
LGWAGAGTAVGGAAGLPHAASALAPAAAAPMPMNFRREMVDFFCMVLLLNIDDRAGGISCFM